jgi:hypothetical protein
MISWLPASVAHVASGFSRKNFRLKAEAALGGSYIKRKLH